MPLVVMALRLAKRLLILEGLGWLLPLGHSYSYRQHYRDTEPQPAAYLGNPSHPQPIQ
jgi:hypothetical protein